MSRNVTCEALRPYGRTIFTEMTALSNRVGAVNLSQGFPDFDGPEFVRRASAEPGPHPVDQARSSVFLSFPWKRESIVFGHHWIDALRL